MTWKHERDPALFLVIWLNELSLLDVKHPKQTPS